MGCGSAVNMARDQEAASGESEALHSEHTSLPTTKVEEIWISPITKLGHAPSVLTAQTDVSEDKAGGVSTASTNGGNTPPAAPRLANAASATLSDAEKKEAWRLSGYEVAKSGHSRPIALWIVGPSAVGKSTLAHDIASSFGIGTLNTEVQESSESDAEPSPNYDAVFVDGEFFREVWSLYSEWAKSSDWASAYPTLKKTINKAKKEMLSEASRERKHLIMPHTCLDLGDCIKTASDLEAAGYINHVLAVSAPREEVAERGRERERKTGKRYAPGEFDHSVAAFGPMIAACNGRYEVLYLTKGDNGDVPSGPKRKLQRELVASGDCGLEPQLPAKVFG
mmetsp:Transcript_37420/g.79368  ORF Transcript_37420/g.79368 Transcript_37420/m.79368 type:complete len:338 (+) Transcript_37420:369-1382(+)